jgi:hypothetical protein
MSGKRAGLDPGVYVEGLKIKEIIGMMPITAVPRMPDFAMGLISKQFRMLRDLVHVQCGIDLHDGKQQLLQARLVRRLRATGIEDVYIRKLEEDSNELVRRLKRNFKRRDHRKTLTGPGAGRRGA